MKQIKNGIWPSRHSLVSERSKIHCFALDAVLQILSGQREKQHFFSFDKEKCFSFGSRKHYPVHNISVGQLKH